MTHYSSPKTRGEVGPYRPYVTLHSLTYIGPDPELKGKRALVGFTFVGGATVAQFTDIETGYGWGWHHFPHRAFWET